MTALDWNRRRNRLWKSFLVSRLEQVLQPVKAMSARSATKTRSRMLHSQQPIPKPHEWNARKQQEQRGGFGTDVALTVTVPPLRASMAILFPRGSERLVAGSTPKEIRKAPVAELEATLNRTCPRPTLVPELTTVPERGITKTSETDSDWPLLGPVKSGPNNQFPAKT